MNKIIVYIILILLLAGSFIIIGKVSKRFATVKVTQWFFYIYIGILFLSSAFIPFISDDSFSQKGKVQETLEVHDLLKKLSKTGIAQSDQMYLLKESSFVEYQNQTLTVESSNEDMIRVFVERKPNDDNKVEALSFSTGIIEGYDISNNLTPYNVKLKDNTLTIISPLRQNINMKIAKSAFPIRQFTGESIFINHSSFKWNQVVYLQIPNDLELIVDDDYISLEFINK